MTCKQSGAQATAIEEFNVDDSYSRGVVKNRADQYLKEAKLFCTMVTLKGNRAWATLPPAWPARRVSPGELHDRVAQPDDEAFVLRGTKLRYNFQHPSSRWFA